MSRALATRYVNTEKVISIKAIPTWYGGHCYRSKTEAKWAVFCDVLELSFKYEAEGFVIKTDEDEFCYLPDFLIPPIMEAWPTWIEVKGTEPTEREIEKLVYACRARLCDGLLVIGEPDLMSDLLWCVQDADGLYQVKRMKQSFLAAIFGDTDRAFLVARSYRFDKGHDIASSTLQRMFA